MCGPPAKSLRRPRHSARIWWSRTESWGETDAELRSEQHLRQDPARRITQLQGLRGRQGVRIPRHHAAFARHTLVLPKAPARNILDVSPDDFEHVMKVAQKIA